MLHNRNMGGWDGGPKYSHIYYKKYEKRAFGVEISTFVRFEIGSVDTSTARLP